MAVIDFKSVGDRADALKFQPVVNEAPIGIKTPLRPGTQNDGIFAMHFDIEDQIQDNLRNLLLTNHGERLGLYDFGSNLKSLSFEHGQDAFDAEAVVLIKAAIDKYMPFLSPRTFESNPLAGKNGLIERVNITITYDVPRLGIIGKKIMVSIFVRG